jgi:8-oxo-dGTP pyrophosphatase MutT (NUDIX family)
MDRAELLDLLDGYAVRHPDEGATVDRIRALLRERERAYHRDCFSPGHITASAWIVSRESGAALFTHHRKLGRWLQLGGHTDGSTDVLASAIREAEEESGLRGFRAMPIEERPAILDVDVHLIPARGSEPAHEHHDVRFLLEVSERQAIVRQEQESHAVRWLPPDEVKSRFDEESVLRMARKAAAWLARDPVGPPRAR